MFRAPSFRTGQASCRRLAPVSLAVLMLFPPLVRAQSAAAAADSPRMLGEVLVRDQGVQEDLAFDRKVVSGSRLGLSVKETPAAVTVIDREAIERRGADNTQEILKGVAGMTVAAAPGAPGAVFYRGFSGGSVTQLFNGITVQYDSIAGRPVDSWIYEQVEAIGGPSSFLFGAGAIGGSVNYITKLARRDGDFSEAKARYGSYDATQLAIGSNRRLNESNVVRLDLNRDSARGWSDGSRREAWQLATSLLTDITPRLSHTLALEYQKETVDRPYWGTPLLKPFDGSVRIDEGTRFKNYNVQDGLYGQTVQWVRSILDFKVSDRLKWRNTLYHYDALRDYRNVETYAFNAANTQVARSGGLLQRHDQSLNGNRFEFNWDSAIASLASSWAGGIDYSLNKQTRFPASTGNAALGNVDPYNPDPGNFSQVSGLPATYTPDRSNRITTLALFLENRTFLTGQLSLLTGLRQDRIDLEVTNHRAVSAADPAYFKRTYSPLTGRAALTYDLTPNANVYVQYSTAADPPAGILATANFSQVRDFDLTTGKQAEVGSKFSFAEGRGNGSVALYEITRKNIAVSDPNNPGTSIPVGQQSSRGIEVSAAYRITPRFQASGNFSLVAARYDDFTEKVGNAAVSRQGNRPTNIPARVGNLWLSYSPVADWRIGGDLRYVSDRYADSANTLKDDSYVLLGAFAQYKLDRKSTLTARIKNLTDKIYAENLSGTNMVYLGAPRTFDLSLQTSF